MTLSEMREVLAGREIRLTKSLGQNFLHDGNQLRRIVAAAALTPADKVLEIGPGLGPLTELLLAQAGRVLAIEKDARLVAVLQERFGAPHSALRTPRFELIQADALEFIKRERRDWRDWKLVANLPYSMASPLLVELALSPQGPKQMTVTLQWEVVQRILASAGDPDYGVLTLFLQLNYTPRESFKIPASCFFPAPAVDSGCVTLVRREKPLLPEELRGAFAKIVKCAFSQRRKMVLKLLKAEWPVEQLQRAFVTLNILPQERAEKISLEQFVALTEEVSSTS